MNIVFRTDASTQIGSGHVMRCLTLANALCAKGHYILFVCRNYPGNLNKFILKCGHNIKELPFGDGQAYSEQPIVNEYSRWLWVLPKQDALETMLAIQSIAVDLLVIDHYALDYEWEAKLRCVVKKILVIDDLANRPHNADILLDQNYYSDMQSRYKGLLPNNCTQLLGLKYVILRPEFQQIRKKRCEIRKSRIKDIVNILVYLGASDPNNVTLKVLKSFPEKNRYQGEIHVVVGAINPNNITIKEFCSHDDRMFYHCQPSYYDSLLINADWCIGAGGGSMWERFYINLIGTSICIAEHQKQPLEYLSELIDQKYFYANSVYKLKKMLLDITTSEKIQISKKQTELSEMMMSVDQVTDEIMCLM